MYAHKKEEPVENEVIREIEKQEAKEVHHYYSIICTPNLPKASFLFYLLCSEVLVHPNMMAEHMEELDLTFTSTLRTQFLSKLKQESALSSHFRYLLVLCPAWDMIIFHKQAGAELGQAQYKICQLGKLISSASSKASIEVDFHQDTIP